MTRRNAVSCIGSAALTLALSTAGAPASAQVNCPMKLMTAEGTVHALSNARVFRGAQTKTSEIAPVHGSFDLAPTRGKDGGEPFSLVCTYEGTDQTHVLQVPRSATTCNVADAGAGTVAGCR